MELSVHLKKKEIRSLIIPKKHLKMMKKVFSKKSGKSLRGNTKKTKFNNYQINELFPNSFFYQSKRIKKSFKINS